MKIALTNFMVISFMLMSANLWSVNDAKITSSEFPKVLSEFEFFIGLLSKKINSIPSKEKIIFFNRFTFLKDK